MINNEVRDNRGAVVGFWCQECREVYQSMWGETCNGCREKERRHQEVLAALRGPRTSTTESP